MESADDPYGRYIPVMFNLIVAMMVIPTICVMLRFWSQIVISKSKSMRGKRFWWDDWTALLALPLSLIHSSLQLRWLANGLGQHTAQLPPEEVTRALQTLYIGYFFFNGCITVPKFSALLTINRIFGSGDGKLRKAVYITMGLIATWLVVILLVITFQCSPIHKAWDPLVPGNCIDQGQWWRGTSISSVLLDLAILILPLPSVWRLHLSIWRRIFVSMIFIVGYCVIAISIGRLVVITRLASLIVVDPLYYTIVPGLWIAVEGPISIVGICLPNIFSLCLRGYHHGPSSLFTTKRLLEADSAAEHYNADSNMYSLGRKTKNPNSDSEPSSHSSRHGSQGNLGPYAKIQVQRDVDVSVV